MATGGGGAAGGRPTPGECEALVAAVRGASRRLKPLRRAWHQLAGDLLAVACGLRPLFLLDYAFLPAGDLRGVVADAARACPAAARLVVLQADNGDCLYPARLDLILPALQSQLQALSSSSGAGGAGPLVVAAGPGGAEAGGGAATGAAAGGLAALLATVESLAASMPPPGGAEEPPPLPPLLDLGGAPGLPALPTLNGWLLGYPAVYHVLADEGAEAARSLSACTMHLYTAAIPCSALSGGGGGDGGGGGGGGEGAVVLQRFTVPAPLSARGGGEPWAAAWLAGLRARGVAARAGGLGVWGEVQLTVEVKGPQAIAL